jgi:hypothetical protein
VLTVLQQKLAEAHGLAQAATAATTKVEERTGDEALRRDLQAMRIDAEETRARCLLVVRVLPEELFEELRAHSNSTYERALDLAGAWFKAGTDVLQAWGFLAMGEAAEVAVWSAVATLASRADADEVAELAAWALPVQQRHLATALQGAVVLATELDPVGPRWG